VWTKNNIRRKRRRVVFMDWHLTAIVKELYDAVQDEFLKGMSHQFESGYKWYGWKADK
jgi:hypothetical protein